LNLNTLLDGLAVKSIHGTTDINVRSIVHDSRQVEPGDLFIAIREPSGHDGHHFIEAAINNGAIAVVHEGPKLTASITIISVPDTHLAYSLVAACFFGFPASQLNMVGVTGTNGKTTVAYMIDTILREAGKRSGLIGTTGSRFLDLPFDGKKTHTTPYPMHLHETLQKMADKNAEYVVMEVSSQGLASDRLASIKFDQAVFTNLTRDHLDEHKTIEAYREAKMELFSNHLDESGCAIINEDDPSHPYFRDASTADILTYSLNSKTDIRRVGPINCFSDGTVFNVQIKSGVILPVSIPLTGRYNASNALAAIGVSIALHIGPEVILNGLKKISVPGRLERIECGQGINVLVDFAHTPDALNSVLSTCREWTEGALIVVFGCGGDRDPGKRPLMAQAACNHSDYVIITTDNPRSEPIGRILGDTEAGLSPQVASVTIENRKEAIDHAISHAQPGDTVLIAGRGDEPYQIIEDHQIEFDDRVVAKDLIEYHYG
jgi:UDP-N-acetylmuramoyl-L-alanyl-D-glutamate--2,6-diaminopimelate ligase